mmetsp:Transcript_22850/g.52912  ORF Transcript_22850/g.52912 Transcript_22850/m.52912 type:complete len:209 (+) Transcript_22850:260-886(+)
MTNNNNTKAVDVTITSDLMCPWCYVGLRKLQEASKVSGVDTNIVWKPFLLRPDLPEDGAPKGGTPSSRVPIHLRSAGESVGIDFTGLTSKTPNTILFHATMKMLLENKVEQTPFQEEVFDAYFTQGIFPDRQVLLDCAKYAGVKEWVEQLYEDPKRLGRLRNEVMEEAQAASYRGVSSVPFFEFNGNPAFSGAQDVQTFVRFLERHAE